MNAAPAPELFEPHVPATVTLPIAHWELIIDSVSKQNSYDRVKEFVPQLTEAVKRSAREFKANAEGKGE